ncbi:MAG: hypothetical protein DMF61_05725 [Blastocatellia bacterium AA13]|nr:MAG: hypothetical protein DMF61_05725 [Blastocatellia bacterium AA13]
MRIGGELMKKFAVTAVCVLCILNAALAQKQQSRNAGDDQVIRISTELVQLDVVVTDKSGKIKRGLERSDFEIYENGKKQATSFFEFVDSGKTRHSSEPGGKDADYAPITGQGPSASQIGRVFAFVVDDLTIDYDDLNLVRKMLNNFVDNEVKPNDLIAIVRTVGGKGLLQQFSADKALLHRAISTLTPVTHQLAAFNNPAPPRLNPQQTPGGGTASMTNTEEINGGMPDSDNPLDDTNRAMRAFMSLGTAGFVVDSMKQLPGRKSLVLISGGLPVLSANAGTESANLTDFLNSLTDRATRASVSINTMDIRGLKAFSGIAGFADTPARSAMDVPVSGQRQSSSSTNDPRNGRGFGRVPDEALFGDNNPFDEMEGHNGLRILAAATGGISVLSKNDFDDGLQKIAGASDGYYLLAYTPSDTKFNGDFRKVEVKVKADGIRVYSRRGYLAREEKPQAAPATKQDQLLAAIKSPLALREVEMDATLLYKRAPQNRGAVDIDLVIDSKKLRFESNEGKHKSDLDVAGFVFDQFGKLRGGFSETIAPVLNQDEFARIMKGGLSYSANTVLAPGVYQVRIAVRDNKTGSIGTLSRYLEIPDLSKARLAASSLLLAAVPAGEMDAKKPTPITADRRISNKQDLRYAVILYNAKLKDGRPQIKSQLIISRDGEPIFKQPEEMVTVSGKDQSEVIKWGQLALSKAKPGRYTMTLVVTDELAEKKTQTVTRSMDFMVVD